MEAARHGPLGPATPSARLPVPLVASYLAAYLLLDWASYIHPLGGLNITPWNPQPALAVALLWWNRRAWWLAWLGLALAELAVRGWPQDPLAMLASTAAMALVYAAIARVLAMRLDAALVLGRMPELLWFLGIVVGGALLAGTVFVVAHVAGGQAPGLSVAEAIVRYWIGDAVGLIVTLPLLLVVLHPLRRHAMLQLLRRPETAAVALAAAFAIGLVFGRDDAGGARYFYLLLLPVAWAAVRLGVEGAVLVSAWTQLGSIVAMQWLVRPDLAVFEQQMLMAVLTMTGLLLGAAVDERQAATAELRNSLRLASAGQMAAAMAHELSQPLTAIGHYAQALEALTRAAPTDAAQLRSVAERLGHDVQRAGEVVRRLRDFFRTGASQLQATPLDALVADAAEGARRRAAAHGVDVEAVVHDTGRVARLDAVQIGMVLRNLLANGIDAAAAGAVPAWVRLDVRASAAGLRIEVSDSGAGVPASRLGTLFDAAPSDKPGGMGVGLSLCRAVVEGHGGRLWAEPGPPGRFVFTLPTDADGDAH